MRRYVDSLEEAARACLPEEVHRYFVQGAGDGVSAAEATAAWDAFRFVPLVLRDVTDVEVGTTLLGTEVASPLAVAPSTLQRAAHPRGEVAMAEAVRDSGSLLVVSSNAGSTFAQIGATEVPWWLQIYVTADRAETAPVVERALESGARALVLTADTPVVAAKAVGETSVWDTVEPGWLRVNFPEGDGPGLDKARDLGPQDIAWLANRFEVPVVVKGVLSPVDARRCVDAGAAAVWVSNHGGRQLDRAAPTASMLAGVVDEVGSAAEVYVDGGVRRGVHALAAVALGARGVFLGRPPLLALASDGPDGVRRVLDGLREELVEALTLAGVTRVEDVTRSLLTAR